MMSLRGKEGFSLSNRLGIATSFSFNGLSPNYTNGKRYGFYFDTNLILHNEYDSEWVDSEGEPKEPVFLKFRCVRDTPSAY